MILPRVFASTEVPIRLPGRTQMLPQPRRPHTVVGRLLAALVLLEERAEHGPVLQDGDAADATATVAPGLPATWTK